VSRVACRVSCVVRAMRACVCGGSMSAYEGGIEGIGRALDLLGLALFGDPPRELLGERLYKDLPPAAAAHSVP